MELGGRQWLWTNDVLPYADPEEGAAYVETADTGGYDECFPTVAPCHLPPSAGPFGGLDLPDHGELWSQRAQMRIATPTTAAMEATSTWHGTLMPYRFTRSVRVGGDGAVTMRYKVINKGSDRIPFLWSAHPLLPITPDTRLVIPEGARVRVAREHGVSFGRAGAEHRWPHFRLAQRVVNMSRPDEVARKYACKLFVDLPPGPIVVGVEEQGVRLEAHFNSDEVPMLGLWLNRRGWAGVKRAKPYLNLGFEPCIGAPDSLAEAMGTWSGAHWLDGGETRRWKLVWRAVRTAPAEGNATAPPTSR